MRSSICTFNTAAALHRIFVAPIERQQLSLARRTTLVLSTQNSPGLALFQRRNFYVDTTSKAEKARLPRNKEITSPSIILVNEDGKLTDPRPTKFFLETLDLSKFILQTVVAARPGVPPICKVQNKASLLAVEKLRKKNDRKTAIGSKTIELNWAIDQGDLKHRLKKLQGFLEKGLRVEVLLATKRKGKRALDHEAKEVIEKIEATIKEVEGVKEYKPREGKFLQQLSIFIEGKKLKSVKEEADVEPGNQEAIKIEVAENASKKRRMRWQPLELEEEGKVGAHKGPLTGGSKAAPTENPAMAALRRAVASRR